MAKKDFYEVLGVSKTATKKEIKSAYRDLVKKYHPDKNPSHDAEEKFKEAQEAYDVLMDDEKRSAYDKYGHASTDGFGGYSSGGFNTNGFGGYDDLNDIFSQFFGQGFGGFSNSEDIRPRRGSDIEVTLEVPFIDAVFGAEEEIAYKRKVPCEDCKATGAYKGTSFKTCSNCGGSGYVMRVQSTFLGRIQTQVPCEVCMGTGRAIEKECPTCSGKGYEEKTDNFVIKIPAGIPNGVTLKFQNRGNAAGKGGQTGSLYVNIEVIPDEDFERRGDDIYSEVEISAPLAALGGSVDVRTVHGNVKLKIPSGTQPGKIFKLSGKGGPKFRGRGNGDQYVKTIVKIPEKLTKEEQKAWENLL